MAKRKTQQVSKLEQATKWIELIKQVLIIITLLATLYATIGKGYAIESVKFSDIEINLSKSE